jgi:hypothetical protein
MDLDHDEAIERGLPSQKDPRHPAPAELSLELVVRSEHPTEVLFEICHEE